MAATASKPRPVAGRTPSGRAGPGKATRSKVPRSSHAGWAPQPSRPDPVALLEEQSADRVPELVPIRYGRMSSSPFAFFRGAAYVMASDLAATPRTGITVQACGDAHLMNFGVFASPERALVFDLNDFDETLSGPWEWDVKRLAASIAVAARDRAIPSERGRGIVEGGVAAYRDAMRRFAAMPALDVWYSRIDEREIPALVPNLKRRRAKDLEAGAAKAMRKDSSRAFAKLAHHVNGGAQIVADPPLIVPIADLTMASRREVQAALESLVETYRASLSDDMRHLMDRYRYADAARKVVGVGSVGTRAWVILLLGHRGDPLFLQAKETTGSVLEPFLGKTRFNNQGRRVVEGQRLMQAASDIFLGWLHVTDPEGQKRDYYVRQLWDWKGSANVAMMRPTEMAGYARLCAWTLARAHARSGDAVGIASYLGSSNVFPRAIAAFAEDYADQNERDYTALLEAIESGRVKAEKGV